MKYLILLVTTLLLWSCSSNIRTKQLKASDYGDQWPLTVDGGIVKAIRYNSDYSGVIGVVFECNGKASAVNDLASSRSEELGYSDLTEIWADDPQFPGFKKNIGPVLDTGLKLFEE